MNRTKSRIMIFLCVALCIMVVGYSAFSTLLTINGTANINSNWSVYISNVTIKDINGNAKNAEGSPKYSGLTATMSADLDAPGDYIIYDVTVINDGTLDVVVNDVVAEENGADAIIFEIDDIEIGTKIPKKTTKTFTVKITYDPTVTGQPEKTSKLLTINIGCVQDLGQEITPIAPDIEEPRTVEELQEKYVFTYYSTLNGAVNDVNNGTIGANADTTKENAVAGIYNDHGKIYVVLLKDTTETDRVRPSVDMTINLGGNKLTSNNSRVMDILSGNITIDGRLEGSTIEATVSSDATKAIQHRSGNCIINGGTYIALSDSSDYAEAIHTLSNMIVNNANIIASNTTGYARGFEITSGGNLIISNSDIKIQSNSSAEIQSIYIGKNSKSTISNTNIYANSVGAKSFGLAITEDAEVTISNSNIQAYANYKSDYSQNSIGISNNGIMTINNSYVRGVHSGIQSGGTLTVNGGTYEGYGHGGFYFSGTGTTSYVSNATIRQTDMPEGYTDLGGSTNNSGFYIGGNEGKDNITVYMDNCNIDGKRYPFVLRGTSGEQNNTLYISNSLINKDSTGKIRIDNDTHKLYLGVGNNFTSDDTTRPSAVITTDEVYIKQ